MGQTFTNSKIKMLQQLQQCSGVNLRTAAENDLIKNGSHVLCGENYRL